MLKQTRPVIRLETRLWPQTLHGKIFFIENSVMIENISINNTVSAWTLLRLMVGWTLFFLFLENSTSSADLQGSGLKSIFQF